MKILTRCSLLLLTLYCSGCTTMSFLISDAEYVARNGDLHTIRYPYGSLSEDELRMFRDSYDKKLADKANEICSGSKFEVVEKSRHPSTLANLKTIGSNDFFWVVRCQG